MTRRRRVVVSLAVAMSSASGAAVSQSSSPRSASDASLVAMGKIDRWVGEWSGSGWSVSATGVRTEFSLRETVQRKAGGMVLMAEGRGTATSGVAAGTVTHDGLAMVFFDEKSGRYRWYGYDATAGSVEAEVTLVNGGFEWSIVPAAGTTVRFTIILDAARWHEVGEVSTDGKTWNRFMEMTLVRRG